MWASFFMRRLVVSQTASASAGERCRRRSSRLRRHRRWMKLAPKLQAQILLSSSRLQYITRKLKEIVGQTAVMLGEHARRAQFQPVGTEVDFGPGAPCHHCAFRWRMAGKLKLSAGSTGLMRLVRKKGCCCALWITSRARRSCGWRRSPTALSPNAHLSRCARYSFAGLAGWQALPAGVLYFHVHNPLLALTNGISPADVQNKLLKRFKMRGLVTAEADTVKLMDDELEEPRIPSCCPLR